MRLVLKRGGQEDWEMTARGYKGFFSGDENTPKVIIAMVAHSVSIKNHWIVHFTWQNFI